MRQTPFLNRPRREDGQAQTMLDSMHHCSWPTSPDSAVATRSQTPFSRQRGTQAKLHCQCPCSSGKSRQGLPARIIPSGFDKTPIAFRRYTPIGRLAS